MLAVSVGINLWNSRLNFEVERQEKGILLLGNWTFMDEVKKKEEKYSLTQSS